MSSRVPSSPRFLPRTEIACDLAIVGGGLSGVCCAVTAARQGLHVALVQDRPVLGGNASSEVRLWVLGATSHMGNNNRWAREGGVIDELLVENMYRNAEGNAVLFDALLLEFVSREKNITLLLNTAVDAIDVADDGTITAASAYCSQNEMRYRLTAPLFCDASGDGIVGFLSGAAFRMGVESRAEFGEALAPPEPTHELLGHSLYFYSRDTGRPVEFVPPAFALEDITRIPRFRELRVADFGCRLWWLEYGGALDTVHQTEEIKWELWRVAYGVWNYIKNSGEFPEAANLTLEWMGMIPGKRESRRFEGDLVLTQQDVVEQRTFPDAVSFGGWAIDLHPSDGVYSPQPGCEQWHSKGVYQIPFRAMYSRNVPNLFITGRLLSASHIAFGSTRVMATCAHNGQAVGMAAVLCIENNLRPRELMAQERMATLQQRLLREGQHIPGVQASDPEDKATTATITASSTLLLDSLSRSGETLPLIEPTALLLPLPQGPPPRMLLGITSTEPTMLIAELWTAHRPGNTTPDVLLATAELPVSLGASTIALEFQVELARAGYAIVALQPNPLIAIELSNQYLPGVLMLTQRMNKAVAKTSVQMPPEGTGIDTFPFWLPERRPRARNLAVSFVPPLAIYQPANIANGFSRPWEATNAWLPALNDPSPTLTLSWSSPQLISRVQITFDTDYDHPMESVLMGHPERIMPGCVRAFEIRTGDGRVLTTIQEHHQTRFVLKLAEQVTTSSIVIVMLRQGVAPSALFEVRCY